ncbi:MAG: phosphatidylserine decarboxylase family protein [Chitinophagales bacterium]|nr:phosphatidylserine decarboxylase family protein [Chitinophagales bacterium]MCZ2392595.1 phosphatidylserine decarboxylase family protein [Chitinophagales bacterium]
MLHKHYIHKEGRKIILATLLGVLLINFIAIKVIGFDLIIRSIIILLTSLFLGFVTYFFRDPKRNLLSGDNKIICPADGKIVVIEEVIMDEYFSDRRLQVSIFMSPTNVHVNRVPISGEVKYSAYHPGKYLVAWHPKSSELNERTTIVIDNGSFDIMMRQIAGKLARRIVNYLEEGHEVTQGEQFGFIKFGSRVDLFLPLDTQIDVKLGQKVKGGVTIIGELKD